MYSSAGSNQENNHSSLHNKSTWLSVEMKALLFELDPVEWALVSLYGQTEALLTVGATLTQRQIPVRGDWRQDPKFIHYTRRVSLEVPLQPKLGLSRFWMILWLFYDILDINIAGILYIPSPYLYVFC